MEEAFVQRMTSEAKHRLREPKVVLRNTEPEVVQFLAAWRKKAHVGHANTNSFDNSCNLAVPAAPARGEQEALHRIQVARCWPKVHVHRVRAFARAVKDGLPK